MPLVSLNPADVANAQLGINLPVLYGFVRGQGNEVLNHALSNKNRIVIRIYSEGEIDGIDRLYINSKQVNLADTTLVHFHPGVDGVLGGLLNPISIGRPSGAAPSAPGGNLIIDGDGESGTLGAQALGWAVLGGFSGIGLLIANDFVHSGTKSMKITNTGSQNSPNTQTIALVGGVPYILQGWIKTDAITGGATLGALLNMGIATGIGSFNILTKNGNYDAGQTTVPTVGLPADGVARGFSFVQSYFIPASSGTVTLLCQLFSTNACSAWFDDVQVYAAEQQVDSFWSLLPANFQPTTFSRKAYLMLNVPPDPAAPSATLTALADLRGCRVRQFDGSGNQTGYAFSTNGAEQVLDAILRTMLKPEWSPAAAAAAGGDLIAAEKARINWSAYADAVAWCNTVIANGQKRFESSLAIVQQTSLLDVLKQLCIMSQLYITEAAGQIYIRADEPRASTFVLTSDHIVPGTVDLDKIYLHGAQNRFIGTYNDLNAQGMADIDTVANTGLSRTANVVTVKTKTNHPFTVGQNVQIVPPQDGTTHDAGFDGAVFISTVPSPTTFTVAQAGANATSGNGTVGTVESRFAVRAPVEDHQPHQNAIGQRGLSLTPIFRVVPQTINMGNNTDERVHRVFKFLLARNLGINTTPYIAPWAGTITCFMDAVDLSVPGTPRALISQLCGDIISIDSTISEEYQGDYEIMKAVYTVPAADGSSSSGSSSSQSSQPTIDLTLLQYLPAAFSDVSLTAQSIRASILGALAPIAAVDSLGIQRMSGTFRNNTVNTNGTFTGGNPLTQSGSTTTIAIAASTMQFGDGQISYNSGSVNPGTFALFYVYGDDPSFLGGAIVYQFNGTKSNQVAANGRVSFGQITTVSGTGGGTGSGGGGAGCFSGNTKVRVSNKREGFTLLSFDELTADLIAIETEHGRCVARKHTRRYRGWMHDMGDGELVTPEHLIKVTAGFFNAARTIWEKRVWFKGDVHTLETITDDDKERHFILGNGRTAHNISPGL